MRNLKYVSDARLTCYVLLSLRNKKNDFAIMVGLFDVEKLKRVQNENTNILTVIVNDRVPICSFSSIMVFYIMEVVVLGQNLSL